MVRQGFKQINRSYLYAPVPRKQQYKAQKLEDTIEPNSVISNGSRNLHAVSVAELIADKNSYKFTNFDNPILSPRQGKNFEFDNKFEDIEKDGISYVLYIIMYGEQTSPLVCRR